MTTDRLLPSTYKTYSGILEEYLNPDIELRHFMPKRFSLNEVINSAKKRSFSEHSRNVLVSALKNQYKNDDVAIDSVTVNQIEALQSPNTFTITTGHQLCLFTGPLYFIMKILHVIKLADQLNEKGSEKFIPVFWMATEDHDFEEINHAHLFNKTLTWSEDIGGAVGNYSTKGLSSTLDELTNMLGDSSSAQELGRILNEAYRNHDNLAAATRSLVHNLFADRGLVIIDGNDVDLKKTFVPYFKKELSDQVIFSHHNETEKNFGDEFKIQVNPRPVNIFYLEENSRKLIEIEDSDYTLKDGNKKWSEKEILQEVEEHPERFSPNVVLRPMYQEEILPNVCYVGGPAEVAYWIQLKSSFESFDLPYPVLNLRNSILWMDKNKMKRLSKLNLEVEDLFLNESLIGKKLADFEDLEDDLKEDINEVNRAFDSLSQKITEVDSTLKPVVLAEGKKIEKQLEQLKGRLLKARKSKNEERVNTYWNLHEKVFPGGSLHERYDNFAPYFLSYHWSFFNHIYEHINPEDSRLLLVKDI